MASDKLNRVKKAVNWAAVELAGEIKMLNSKSARWVAGDALREFGDEGECEEEDG